ncbi:D-alanyl-D-alanine carboxypeptidase/D-alanyl-D-alanine-endopeptidase (penicillin-binding protein 4) [Evansella vedderi]|uniref:D-alanyl-D-alanine carboxypeptidase/D-alanyl-D-alanine-endopeptidase (Penicillin-binding protein 4) n=1 Tax=Evansella vedderi TaxID=38282 RepID=A0ABT9ZTT5_9BACI|nr:D-alanyl-D-alanine carboxypeptidase/D-alanyl-D-alanine-endopeptidase [Evansella vedderi]MDQ0254661.1 D-alanyl-D-alanine carboxypeptidase/D-alanyl-D-alanine-endopeptidase (penicillin-binding protein 4) [Evansella vedderi]
MKHKFICIVTLFLLFLSSQPVDAIIIQDTIQKRLDEFFQREIDSKGAIAGVSVRSADTGKLLYDRKGDIRLRPASNLKLFTAAAALSTLGPDYTYKTEVLTDGYVRWKILHGNLYLKGRGDPTLTIDNLKALVKSIKEQNIKVIRGDLIGDDSWYDDIRYSIDLPWSDETYDYASQISPLTLSPNQDFDTGNIIVEVNPGHNLGEKGEIIIHPYTEYLQIVNNTETVSIDEKTEISMERTHGTNTVTINGKVSFNSKSVRKLIPVWEPTNLVVDVFKELLKEYGIVLLGDAKVGITPYENTELACNTSIPLSKILLPFMKYSNNTHGEMLVKEMGKKEKKEGSWEAGLQVLQSELKSFGIKTEALVLRDGSGISHINLVTANELTKLLFEIQDKDWFPVFMESLPVAGVKEKEVGGTLRYRLSDPSTKGKVFAKTGSLTTISSLSGYAKTKSGQKIIFSILLNNLTDDVNGKKMEDETISILMEL